MTLRFFTFYAPATQTFNAAGVYVLEQLSADVFNVRRADGSLDQLSMAIERPTLEAAVQSMERINAGNSAVMAKGRPAVRIRNRKLSGVSHYEILALLIKRIEREYRRTGGIQGGAILSRAKDYLSDRFEFGDRPPVLCPGATTFLFDGDNPEVADVDCLDVYKGVRP